MARYRDASPHPRDWTNRKLIAELRTMANMENMGAYLPVGYTGRGFPHNDGDAIREATQLYRDSWINPIIAIIESRLVKERK